MEFNNSTTARFFLAWCLLTTTAIALTGCHGVRAALEAGNATTPRGCRGGECPIAYQQTEVELMGALDPEHDALASMLARIAPGDVSKGARNQNTGGCGRTKQGMPYTPCPPRPGRKPRDSYYLRK